MGYDHGGWDAGTWFVMGLAMVLLWGGLVAVVLWAVRSVRPSGSPTTERAEALLAERFARGEIDGEELVRARDLLRGGQR